MLVVVKHNEPQATQSVYIRGHFVRANKIIIQTVHVLGLQIVPVSSLKYKFCKPEGAIVLYM